MLCFPVLFLLLALAAFLPPSPGRSIAAIGLTTWPGDARYARAEILKIRELDYARAARAMGASAPRILLRHLLPNALPPLIVSAAFGVGWAILAEASLSFLGVGLPAPADLLGRHPVGGAEPHRGGVVDRALPGRSRSS